MRKWYVDNADQQLKKRSDEYHTDKAVRELKITRAKDYRQKRKAGAKVQRVYHRTINGRSVQVFSLGRVADDHGTYPQMLINFEKRGWIPEPTIKEHHRLYTEKQARLIGEVLERYEVLKKDTNLSRKGLGFMMQENFQKIVRRW